MPVKHEKTREKDGRWKNGVSGNPNGRPKKNLCITDLLKEIGEQERKDGISLMELVVVKVYDLAISGNMRAIEYLTERIEGKPHTKDKKEAWTRPFDRIVFNECENEDCKCKDCKKDTLDFI